MARFVKVQNKIVNLDCLAYADFLESGRGMLFMAGLTPEKQNIPLDPDDARRIKALLDQELVQSPR